MLEVIDRFETTRMRSMFECFDNINSCFSLLSTLKLGLSGDNFSQSCCDMCINFCQLEASQKWRQRSADELASSIHQAPNKQKRTYT
jgi:hypothetical protein